MTWHENGMRLNKRKWHGIKSNNITIIMITKIWSDWTWYDMKLHNMTWLVFYCMRLNIGQENQSIFTWSMSSCDCIMRHEHFEIYEDPISIYRQNVSSYSHTFKHSEEHFPSGVGCRQGWLLIKLINIYVLELFLWKWKEQMVSNRAYQRRIMTGFNRT